MNFFRRFFFVGKGPNKSKTGILTRTISLALVLILVSTHVFHKSSSLVNKTSSLKRAAAKTHNCVNEDFQYTHETSVWTVLDDDPEYIKGALKFGHALKKNVQKTDVDFVVLTVKDKPYNEEAMKNLIDMGFVNCEVEPIEPSHLEGKSDLDKFGVLHLFAMEIYKTVLFLDSDTFVQGPIDDLLQMDLKGKPIGVTRDIRMQVWVDSFNSGVMLLHPSLQTYDRLVVLLMQNAFNFNYNMADQGFLNVAFKDQWHEIGFLNNANLALYKFQKEFWDQYKVEDIRIIHYTMQKPWNCDLYGSYGPICNIWYKAE